MTYSPILTFEAQEEYDTAVVWYAERSVKAGKNLRISVDNTISMICSNPYRWKNSYANYHELTIKKYPYSIIYEIDEKRKLVMITSIYHHSRDPKKKYDK